MRPAPAQGRWISPDPAGSGWNQYAYGTNPNSFVDPTGLVLCAPKFGDPWCSGNPANFGGYGDAPIAGYYDLGMVPSYFDSDNPFEIPNFPSGGSISIPCDFGICGPNFGSMGVTDGPYLNPDEDGAPYVMYTTVLWPFLPDDAANNIPTVSQWRPPKSKDFITAPPGPYKPSVVQCVTAPNDTAEEILGNSVPIEHNPAATGLVYQSTSRGNNPTVSPETVEGANAFTVLFAGAVNMLGCLWNAF